VLAFVAWCAVAAGIGGAGNVSTFARDEAPSVVLVSPAILVVLWVLLGIPAGLLADCNVQELMTALYASGKQLKEYVGLYLDRDPKLKALRTALKDGLSDEAKVILAELQAAEYSRVFNKVEAQSSAELDIQIVSLKLVQSGNEFPIASSSEAVVVPRLNATDIWICSNEFPFASVVAAFVLYRCKRHSARTDDIQVNLTKELWNCGLLKPSEGELENPGWITLRWLFGIWTGKLSSAAKLGPSAASEKHLLRTELMDLQSDFYPFNWLVANKPNINVPYGIARQVNGRWKVSVNRVLDQIDEDGELLMTSLLSSKMSISRICLTFRKIQRFHM
jgi:hypothetical protein